MSNFLLPKNLGFSDLEIAQFLDSEEARIHFQKEPTKTFMVMHEGDEAPLVYSLELMQKVFGFKYLPHLKFSNYASLKSVIRNCPLILRTCAGGEARELAVKYADKLNQGYVANTIVKWINGSIGYGLFAAEDLPYGSYIGEYTGLVRRLFRSKPDQNPYCFQYPTRFWSLEYYVIDALWQGNETRFVNHSAQPTLEPACLMQNRLLHTVFFTNQAVKAGEELTFNYGPDFWR